MFHLTATRTLALRLCVLVLASVVLRLPITDLFRYSLLVASAAIVFTGTVTTNPRRWAEGAIVAFAGLAALSAWPEPRIDEGYNFYFNGPVAASDPSLPTEVKAVLAKKFIAKYPNRCGAGATCCPNLGFPEQQGYAFSADAIYAHPAMSRRVTDIDFSDPVYLRLGDVNDGRYNSVGHCHIARFSRDRNSFNIIDRFRLTFPLYLVYRFPADFVGSKLCWRGTMMWPDKDGQFATLDHDNMACRILQAGDIGHDLYAISIERSQRLAMDLHANAHVQIRRAIATGLMLVCLALVLFRLVRWQPRRLRLPTFMIVLALLTTVLVDINFVGGLRPLDDGDDGFTYAGFARVMAHEALAGDVTGVIKGVEPVYYFTPGLRYFRTAELFVFGDTFLGYLSIMLALPFVVLALFRRFLSEGWALVMTLGFVATPAGMLFGSSYLLYIMWAARGFADPLAFFLLFSGMILLVREREPEATAPPMTAFAAGVLMAAATFCRPNVVLASIVMVSGAAAVALYRRQIVRAAAVCAGFATLIVSPLHNFVFGHSLVPFSDNVNQSTTLLVSPLDYVKAVGEVLLLNFGGPHVSLALHQVKAWLSGATELPVLIPVHAAAVAVLVRIGFFPSRFNIWLRVIALATLLQHGIGICYNNAARYNLGTWLLTALVAAAWIQGEGLQLFDRQWPGLRQRWTQQAWLRRLANCIVWLARFVNPDGVRGGERLSGRKS